MSGFEVAGPSVGVESCTYWASSFFLSSFPPAFDLSGFCFSVCSEVYGGQWLFSSDRCWDVWRLAFWEGTLLYVRENCTL